MKFTYKFFGTVFLSISLISCTAVAPSSTPTPIQWSKRTATLETVHNWRISGKIAVITRQDSGSATVDWVERGDSYTIDLMGPLGSNAIKLTGQPNHVILESANGKKFEATNPEELLAKSSGLHIPVSYLKYWIRGLPVPQLPHATIFDQYHRIKQLTQNGWTIQFLAYTSVNGIELPSKAFIKSNDLDVKIVVYRWQLL